MVSVTQRITQVKQPRGGYLNPKDLVGTVFDDGIELNTEENIHASLVGLAVDYLTRYMMGSPIEKAFAISLKGSRVIQQEDKAKEFLRQVKGLDNQSITYACKLVGYDVCARAHTIGYKPVENISADEQTKHKPSNEHTLQLLMYYILGHRSVHKEFQDISKLGIYNPRLNTAYLLEISKINLGVRLEVAVHVVGAGLDN
jgi:hypothetical protein